MKMSKLSNQTNSQDPQAVNSRVFVGNLNTFQCSKTDVERMFQRYGRLAGISMHKGYAFVQFTNLFDARNACLGEDGRNILSQTLDVNMVAEPKSHQVGRSRQNVNKTGNDWEYYYDSYYTSTLFPPRPMKRPRLQQQQQQQVLTPSGRLINGIPNQQQQPNGHQQQQQQQQNSPLHNGHHHQVVVGHSHHGPMNGGGVAVSSSNGILGDEVQHSPYLMHGYYQNGGSPPTPTNGHHSQPPPPVPSLSYKTYSNPDVLICGNCRECFSEITELLDHKRTYCKLRFACKCQHPQQNQQPPPLQSNGNSCAAPAPVAVSGAVAAAETPQLSTKISSSPSHTTTTTTNSPETTTTEGGGAGEAAAVSSRLLCVVCKSLFQNPWDLMVHVQAAHMINIYELGASAAAAEEEEVEKNGDVSSVLTENTENGEKSSFEETDKENNAEVTTPEQDTGGDSPMEKEEDHRDIHFSSNGLSNSAALQTTNNHQSPSLHADLQVFALENAGSSSPISQIEIETGENNNNNNKLASDSALMGFTCPGGQKNSNVAVMGALSIVRSV